MRKFGSVFFVVIFFQVLHAFPLRAQEPVKPDPLIIDYLIGKIPIDHKGDLLVENYIREYTKKDPHHRICKEFVVKKLKVVDPSLTDDHITFIRLSASVDCYEESKKRALDYLISIASKTEPQMFVKTRLKYLLQETRRKAIHRTKTILRNHAIVVRKNFHRIDTADPNFPPKPDGLSSLSDFEAAAKDPANWGKFRSGLNYFVSIPDAFYLLETASEGNGTFDEKWKDDKIVSVGDFRSFCELTLTEEGRHEERIKGLEHKLEFRTGPGSKYRYKPKHDDPYGW